MLDSRLAHDRERHSETPMIMCFEHFSTFFMIKNRQLQVSRREAVNYMS